MKLNNTKLNKKNFWIPFLISSVLSFLILFFVLALWFNVFSNGIMDYILWMISKRYFILFILLIFASIPSFFIIKRLLSKTPKKVFYFELPILVIIYSFISSVNIFIGLMIGGPIDLGLKNTLIIMFPPIIFVILWLVLLTISLYFYYKKFNLLHSKNL